MKHFLILFLSTIALAEHVVSTKDSKTPEGFRRELISSDSRCVLMHATTPKSIIPYWLDTQTQEKFYIPEIQLSDYRITAVQDDEPTNRLDEYGELTFKPIMTPNSHKELEALQKEIGTVRKGGLHRRQQNCETSLERSNLLTYLCIEKTRAANHSSHLL